VVDEGAPDVHASSGQLGQVVVNLVSNGARAIPEERRGEVRVRIATSPEGRAVLEVRDDWTGIDRDGQGLHLPDGAPPARLMPSLPRGV
jgi:signal transduction histidine kinase